MINPFETSAAGIYKLNDFYSHNGSSGSSQGEIMLYADNKMIGSANDADNYSRIKLKRTILGLYDPYNNAIELIKIKDGRWSPFFGGHQEIKLFQKHLKDITKGIG